MEDFITPIITALTIVPIVIGFLLGLLRGRNRSILRLILVAACAVGAFFLKDMLIDAAFGLEIEGQSLEQYILNIINEAGEIPEYLITLVISIVKVIIGLVVFLVLFLVLQFITWIIVFPILKIFVRKGLKKGVLFGGIVGILQGVLVAFVICAPITGAVFEVNKISKMEVDGQTIQEAADLPEFETYLSSPFGKIYTSTGSWFFDAITTYTDEDGNEVTLDSTVQAADTGVKVMQEVTKIQETLNQLGNPDSDKSDADVLRDVAGSISNMGTAISETSDGGKQVLQQLITSVGEMVSESTGSGTEEGGVTDETTNKVTEIISKIDVENLHLESAAEAIVGVADYIDKEQGNIESVPEDSVEKIINGLAENMVVVEMIPEDTTLVELSEEDAQKFHTEIEKHTELSQEDKEKLFNLLHC